MIYLWQKYNHKIKNKPAVLSGSRTAGARCDGQCQDEEDGISEYVYEETL